MPDPRGLPGPDFPIQVGALAETSDGFSLGDPTDQLLISEGTVPVRADVDVDADAARADAARLSAWRWFA